MRAYELVLVLEPSSTESERKKILETVKKWLSDAKIANISEWGKKNLARPIKRLSEGFFVLLEITTETIVAKDLERRLLAEGGILRHLLVRKS